MKVLAIGRPPAGMDARNEIALHASAELHALWELYRAGTVREMYSPGGPGSVLVLEAASAQDARAELDGLPLVEAGVIEFEVLELYPFGALSMLFARGEGA